ncbi:hypothetical protein BDV06DRAFT_235834 [Aspergillus oleicola]
MSVPAKRKSSFDLADQAPKLRRSPSFDHENSEPFIIHRVLCSSLKDHSDHPHQTDFFDAPRLFLGDSRASNLRGEDSIEDTEAYLGENEQIRLIWIKFYSCNVYHESIENQFQALPTPQHPMNATIRRYFYVLNHHGPEPGPEFEEIAIIAKSLREKVKEITEIRTERISTTKRTKKMDTVVDRLYTHLRRSRTALDQPDLRMTNLLQTMGLVFRQEYSQADDLFSRGCVSQNHLSKLFWPNEVIVTIREGHPRAYVLQGWPAWEGESIILSCVTWSFDGRFYQETEEIVLDWTFGGEDNIPITKLSAYPLRFDEGMKERLISRGRTFWRYREGKYVSYLPSAETQKSKPRYMIDARTYQHVHPTKNGSVAYEYLSKDAHQAELPPDENFQLLLPATMPGYGFHDKKWISLSVENIQEIEWNVDTFKHLVLKSTKKELIRALVEKHTATSEASDVIEGKGNGLIMLLHGGPGTGKTLTAESVAELTRRPLYRVTCGDIGTNAEEVEQYLESALYLGAVWKCVVLLDEADVFLEERTQQDLQRNALVSVFLRVLEYYSGILILTSNRIGTFDEAFKSRVQLTLHYPRLDKSSRRRVWSNFITRLHQTNPSAKADQILDNIDELANFELNGREIRNSIRTSLLLAEFRKKELQYSHLMEVIDVSNEFVQYLRDIHGHGASEWAKSQRIRTD